MKRFRRIRSVKLAQFGVRFSARGPNDLHVCAQIISEDDGNWSASMGDSFSSFWLPDLITALQLAQATLEAKAQKSRDGFGWCLKKAERSAAESL